VAASGRLPVTVRGSGLGARLGVAAAAVLTLASCRSLDRFDTEKPAAYCGSIIGGSAFESGFIRKGAPPSLELKLELDTSSLTDRPGALSSNDGAVGFCRPAPLFDEAPLRAIPELLHDALSQADLGQGHEHDFFAWVDSACEGTMLAVVSLLTNGAVEVRLLKPGPDLPALADADQAKRAGFGLFYLQRSQTGCGF
jgi:hypothetical protein